MDETAGVIPQASISLAVLMVGGVLKWYLSSRLDSSVDSHPATFDSLWDEGTLSSITAVSSFPIPEKFISILY